MPDSARGHSFRHHSAGLAEGRDRGPAFEELPDDADGQPHDADDVDGLPDDANGQPHDADGQPDRV